MRICLFTPNFLPALGGAERAADTIVRGLIKRGHQTTVLCQKSGPTPDVPYPVRQYKRPPAQHLWPEVLAWPLYRAHRQWTFDLVLAFYGYPTGYAAGLIKKTLGCKVVISSRGGDMYKCFHGLTKPRVAKTIRSAYLHADRIISVSQWITSRINQVCGNNPSNTLPPIDTVPNGIDLVAHDQLRDQTRNLQPPQLSPTIPGNRFILHLATLNPVKDHNTALQAINRLRDTFKKHRLTYAIVGQGQSYTSIKKTMAQMNLEDIIQLLGTRTGLEKAWLLDNALFMVSTSREEGMPNVVLESMASGLPILASDIGPHRELIQNNKWGLLFQSGNVDSLTNKLSQMINTDMQPFQNHAMQIRNDYSLEKMIAGVEQSCHLALGLAN